MAELSLCIIRHLECHLEKHAEQVRHVIAEPPIRECMAWDADNHGWKLVDEVPVE